MNRALPCKADDRLQNGDFRIKNRIAPILLTGARRPAFYTCLNRGAAIRAWADARLHYGRAASVPLKKPLEIFLAGSFALSNFQHTLTPD